VDVDVAIAVGVDPGPHVRVVGRALDQIAHHQRSHRRKDERDPGRDQQQHPARRPQRVAAGRAYVVHGGGSIDELSPIGPNLVAEVVDGQVLERRLDPPVRRVSGGLLRSGRVQIVGELIQCLHFGSAVGDLLRKVRVFQDKTYRDALVRFETIAQRVIVPAHEYHLGDGQHAFPKGPIHFLQFGAIQRERGFDYVVMARSLSIFERLLIIFDVGTWIIVGYVVSAVLGDDAQSLAEVEAGLDRYTVPVRESIGGVLAAGLWLAQPVVVELLMSPGLLDRLSAGSVPYTQLTLPRY